MSGAGDTQMNRKTQYFHSWRLKSAKKGKHFKHDNLK